jgi:hypothetical protein
LLTDLGAKHSSFRTPDQAAAQQRASAGLGLLVFPATGITGVVGVVVYPGSSAT